MSGPPYQQQWPTIEKNSGKTSIQKDEVKKRIDALVQNFNKYDDYTGTPHELTSQMSQLSPSDVGASGSGAAASAQGASASSYPGGEAVWGSITNIQKSFPAQYQAFLDTYSQVIENLYKQAGITEKADIDSSISTAGTTGSTQQPLTQNPYDTGSGQT
ncbi:MAG: hypothetical protein ACJ72W_21575 [Actinoallomurus sp.]